MEICTYASKDGPQQGLIEDGSVYHLHGELYTGDIVRGEFVDSIDVLQLLPPVLPSKILCIGRNYVAHAAEFGNEPPTEPILFFKPPSSLIGHQQSIELLPENGHVDHEAELAVIIGREGRFISEDEAFNHILGYTCANDVSDRDFQKHDKQWTRAKGFDTFCSLGPWLTTDLDISELGIRCRVNGELKQNSHTSLMVFKVHYLIAYISRIMTLNPGDLILTGTPAGVSPINPGDEVEVEIEGIGILRNSVVLSSN